MKKLVTGSSGFIGSNLVKYLNKHSHEVYSTDIKISKDEDLRDFNNVLRLTKGIDEVYHFAANVGGIGYLSEKENHKKIMIDNSIINLNIIRACRINGVKKLLFSSSACVYKNGENKESNVIPASPENIYGWEKLNAEKLFGLFSDDLEIKIVRPQNIYGPGCKLKDSMAVADIIKKVIHSTGEIEIWGSGEQVRNWVYVDDFVRFLVEYMESTITGVFNLGADTPISINQLASIIIKTSGKDIKILNIDGPTGAMLKSSDNQLRKKNFKWEPRVDIDKGIKLTYDWILGKLST